MSEPTPDQTTTKGANDPTDDPVDSPQTENRAPFFRVGNPVLISVLTSFLLVTLLTGGLTIFAVLPAGGGSSPVLVAYGSMNLTFVWFAVGAVFVGWVVSGLSRQRWLQITLSVLTFLGTAWLFGLLALSVLLAGLKH